jgi:23S rRNA-/tRNA-specific pseudouridylate synthase
LRVTRRFLHAWRLGFEHLLAGQRIEPEAPLAVDLTATLALLRESR